MTIIQHLLWLIVLELRAANGWLRQIKEVLGPPQAKVARIVFKAGPPQQEE